MKKEKRSSNAKKQKLNLIIIFLVCFLGLYGCNTKESLGSSIQAATEEQTEAIPDMQASDTTTQVSNKVVEEINVLNEGKVSMVGKDNFTYLYLEKEDKQNELAKLDKSYDNYHLEAFDNILGFSGFKLFLKSCPPYNAEVVYVALIDGKAKTILENHAMYEATTNEFSDIFQYKKDVDNDGIEEIISNVFYPASGGSDAVLYDVKGNDFFEGWLGQLLPDDEEYYCDRPKDIQVWYDEDIDKIVIRFRNTPKESSMIKKAYEINCDYVKMGKARDTPDVTFH